MPTYLIQWEAIRWARSLGCEQYDLWGVPDHDLDFLEANFQERSDGLWGVYRFKRGFGGKLLPRRGSLGPCLLSACLFPVFALVEEDCRLTVI